MRRVLVAALILAATASTGLAEEDVGTIAGAGWVSCGEYAARYQQSPKSTEDYFYAWAQGYMSGVNQASLIRKNLRGWRIEKQKDTIRAYCEKHPLAAYGEAVQSVFNSLPNR